MRSPSLPAFALASLLAAVTGTFANGLAAQNRRPAEADALSKLLQQYDKNGNGKVERDEYPRTGDAFTNLDRDKNGVVDAADFALPATRPRNVLPDRKGDKLPKVGDEAPDFELPMLGMKGKTVKLSSFRGDKPVALVFGSYT